jgi:hypothetical protein
MCKLPKSKLTANAVEHNIQNESSAAPPRRPRRPDLSTFFATVEEVSTEGDADRAHNNPHATPTPGDVAAAFRSLAEAFDVMRVDGGGEVLPSLIESLREFADHPPNEVKGMPQTFLDELDRVNNKTLKKADVCPICNNPFLEGKSHPLLQTIPSESGTQQTDILCTCRRIPSGGAYAMPQEPHVRSGMYSTMAEAELNVRYLSRCLYSLCVYAYIHLGVHWIV